MGGRNPRKAIAVKLDISSIFDEYGYNESNGTPFMWMVCTHFQNDLTFDENWYQARLLMNFCQEICDEEITKRTRFKMGSDQTIEGNFRGLVIAGDINLPSWSSPIQYLSAK